MAVGEGRDRAMKLAKERAVVTQLEIDASAETVWSILADFPAYPAWNPFVRSIEGPLVVGGHLRVKVGPPGKRAIAFRPTVLAAEHGRELRWRGRFLVPGVFDGEHFFRVDPVDERRARFVHGEVFRGLLVRWMTGYLEGPTRSGFEAMNGALKARAEGMQGAA
jgi:hypothetical protein